MDIRSLLRPSSLLGAIALAVVSCGLAGLARADLPPPPGETTCTVGQEQKAGETCIACADSYHADVEACLRKWNPQGYSRRCRTGGTSAWTEVWCTGPDGGVADAAATGDGGEPVKKGDGCSVVLGGAGAGSGTTLALVGAALAAALIRRRRR
jgi:MYXO-CTERM domain-containing protein